MATESLYNSYQCFKYFAFLLADHVVNVPLEVLPVLDPGLDHSVLDHPDPDVHACNLPLHPRQTLSNVHQRRSICHRASALLHLVFDHFDLVSDVVEKAGPFHNTTADLLILLLCLG